LYGNLLRLHDSSMIDRGFMLTMQAIRRQLAAMPHDLYLVRLIHNQTRRTFPGERLWTATQLLNPATIGFLRVRNREGCDVYIQPYAGDQNAGYVLVDLDRADASVLDRMHSNGHRPCVVLQTSPGHLQAWIHIATSTVQRDIATAMARQLARDYDGDPASAGWRHLGRLAGFTNQKPARRTLSGYAPWVKVVYAAPGRAPKADALLQSTTKRLTRLPGPVHRFSAGCSHEDAAAGSITAADAAAIYLGCVTRWRIAERFPQPDWSIVDLWVARHLLSQGSPPAAVETILRLASPHFPRRHGDPGGYLHRTVARAAFPPAGSTVCDVHAPASLLTGRACSKFAGEQ
jgi:RepB DNA-primase from phage plasmid